MPTHREHAERANSEARSREHSYDQLQKKTSREDHQMELGFDTAPVPSRDDAQKIVEERKKARQAAAKAPVRIIKPPAANPKGPGSEKRKPSPSSKKKPAKKRSTASKGKKSSASPKKRQTVHVSISLPVFIAAVVVFALLAGSMIAWQIVGIGRSSGRLPLQGEAVMRSVTIPGGMSARQIAQLLADEGVIEEPRAFERYLELSGDATRLQAGSYLLETGMTHAAVAERLIAPPRTDASKELSIYAGYTLKEIDAMLQTRGLAGEGEFLRAAAAVAEERRLPFAEGWFLGGTYTLPREGDAALSLALIMQDALNDALRPYLALLEEMELSLADIVIIASMIQRETNKVAQMPIIAGVIHNRLRSGMPLGIDATLRYGLGVWDRPLTEQELSSDHPYNTRRKPGMPPGGVGSPSPAALDAAFKPALHDHLFYIHDREGQLRLADTYEEHKANIEQYLK